MKVEGKEIDLMKQTYMINIKHTSMIMLCVSSGKKREN